MTIRTRFAPSPTGLLHIGGARTALFNYLFARHNKGEFVLRVEDTDTARSTEESTQAILDGMSWLGLDFDGEPIFQSKRFDLYRKHANTLLEKGLAYKCYCTPEELQQRREDALKNGTQPKYDNRCRNTSETSEKPFALRFKIPDGSTSFKDLIKGVITIEHAEVEDLVILRSDGTPTYNLTVAIDDALMGITHVIRGDDHINNTPKQMLLYKALGFELPEFAHLPMILGSDKKRLSKRHGAESVTAYREMGYLPHALLNYLARLGWSSGDEEIFSKEELIEKFTLDSVGKSAGVFNPDKLLWLNQHYIKEATPESLIDFFKDELKALGVDDAAIGDDKEKLAFIIKNQQERSKTLKDMAEASLFFFKDVTEYDEKAAKKFLTTDRLDLLKELTDRLDGLSDFTEDAIQAVFEKLMATHDLKLGKVAQPVRVALTGGTVSPGIFETITALGKDTTIKRLEKAVEFIGD
jgi:glutamyl-tRNA synthetase